MEALAILLNLNRRRLYNERGERERLVTAMRQRLAELALDEEIRLERATTELATCHARIKVLEQIVRELEEHIDVMLKKN